MSTSKLKIFRVPVTVLLIILLCKFINSTGENDNKVQDILKELVIGKPVVTSLSEDIDETERVALRSGSVSSGSAAEDSSNHLPSPDPKKKLTPEERKAKKQAEQMRRAHRAQEVKKMTEGFISRFEGKHLFKNGLDRGTIDSYKYLSTDSETAREYLIDLNIKLYKGAVLPQGELGNPQFDNWLSKELHSRFVTIVDADVDKLTEAIRPEFEVWRNKELNQNGKLPSIIPDFETPEEQRLTQISFHDIRDANNNIVGVDVKAAQYETTVFLGTDSDGKLSHLDHIDKNNKALEEKTITTFTVEELNKNSVLTEEFWKKLGVPSNIKGIILNEEYEPYKRLRETFQEKFENEVIKIHTNDGGTSDPNHRNPDGEGDHDEGDSNGKKSNKEDGGGICFIHGRAKRSVGSGKSDGCAIYVNKDTGEVESIQAEEFIDEYKKGSIEEKQRLSELANENMDKIIIGSSENGKLVKEKIATIVEMEKIRNHVTVVDKLNEVQDLQRWNNLEPGKFFEKIQELGYIRAKISNSHFVTAIATSDAFKTFTHDMDKTSAALGTFFLAKTIVNGIIHGDTTALAIVGARVGYDVVTYSAVWAGTHFFSTAEIVGTATEAIGKWAGPVGAAADIGLSVWSLTKSIDRLRSSTNQYDRNAAIGDIVEDSIDIAVTATVTIVAIVFPPLAPLVMAVGFVIDTIAKIVVALFQAGNEVNRINSEIPLLGFEKEEVFFSRLFDWFGTRQKDYIDYLLEEKAANDMAVQHNLEFLKENTDAFRGIVFPSRTLAYDGGCWLSKQYCSFAIFGGCFYWEQEVVLEHGCDWNRPCGSETCTNFWRYLNSGYNQFTCHCDKKPETSFGVARANSYVDFREKQKVYWERAVPKDVEDGEFQCKPGSKTSLGYKTSQEEAREEYLCENAIGLMQSHDKWKEGQVLLIDLEDGQDTVYLNSKDNMSSIFRMGDGGVKTFHGGGGKNQFVFDSELGQSKFEGTLVGGMMESDVIILDNNFSRGYQVTVDFQDGYLKSSDGYVSINIQSVEEITGREGETETVVVSCGTKTVALQGGKQNQNDNVIIPQNHGCQYDLMMTLGSYSNVDSKARKGDLTLVVDSHMPSSIEAAFDFYPNSSLKVNVIFMNTSSRDIKHEPLTLTDGQNIKVHIKYLPANEQETTTISFRGQKLSKDELERDIPLLFVEKPLGVPYSVLLMSLKTDQESVVYHTLPPKDSKWKKEDLKRYGSMLYRNVFEITGNDWIVYGGNKSDDFVLYAQPLELHGGDQDDTVRLHEELSQTVAIIMNLTSPHFTGIENVIGSTGKTLSVICACDTKVVAVLGGPSNSPNIVTNLKSHECAKRPPQQIVAKGHSRVEIFGKVSDFDVDGIVVTAISSNRSNNESPLSFQFEGGNENLDGLLLTLQLSHKNWTATGAKSETHYVLASLTSMDRTNQTEQINLKLPTENSKDETFISAPYIQVFMQDSPEIPGQLIIEKDTGNVNVLYMLAENASKIEGFRGIPNIFRVMNDSWTITGGEAGDMFYVFTTAVNGTQIDGGTGKENSLILEIDVDNESNRTFGVNLEKGQFNFHGVPENEKGRVSSIHHFVGRLNKSDIIHTACSTKSVNGRGGGSWKGQEDYIFISGINCTKDMKGLIDLTIDLEGSYSNVKNSARFGSFIYYIRDWMTNDLKIQVTDDNDHLLNFLFDPWTIIMDINFEDDNKLLKFLLGHENKSQIFKMARPNNETGDYTNPIFRFHQPGSPITTDIRVANDTGLVAATILFSGKSLKKTDQILGLPVDINRFLINITTTETSTEDDGKANDITENVIPQGGAGGIIRGSSRSKTNQFWVFQLNSTLDVLDGGEMNPCFEESEKDSCARNYLHFVESFLPNQDMEIYLDIKNGWLRKSGTEGGGELIKHLRNIHELHGRDISTAKDTAYVTCNTRSVHQVEKIFIWPLNRTIENSSICMSVDLVIGIGNETTVTFLGEERKFPSNSSNSSAISSANNVFHYKFTVPRSFDFDASYHENDEGTMLISTATHNYYLPFNLDDLKSIEFDSKTERLSYSLFSSTNENVTYSHHMISSTIYSDQFYTQPVMVTQDGFRIQVARTGSILLSLGASSSFSSLENIQSKVIPAFEQTCQRLDATIMVQTDKEFLYIGHDANASENRNVLQNSHTLVSHLVGSGGNDTIYDIVSLEKDVYIYSCLENCKENCTDFTKQTVELTDVVMAIRLNYGFKYVPAVELVQDDLVISMDGYEDEFPGKIVIVNGTLEIVFKRIQFLLHSSMMYLHFEKDSLSWKLSPIPVVVPQGYVYSIASIDLENGVDIQFDTSAIQLNSTSFTAARNGLDLYLSDIKAKVNETTTVIITDFYKMYVFKPKQQYSLSDFNDSSPFPTEVIGVSVSLPGMVIVLNDTNVLEQRKVTIEENESINGIVTMNNKYLLETFPVLVLKWKCVLHDVEEQILRDMPDIRRMYYRFECADHFWTYIVAVVGGVIGILILLTAKRRLIMDKIRKGASVKEERQPLLGAQISYQTL